MVPPQLIKTLYVQRCTSQLIKLRTYSGASLNLYSCPSELIKDVTEPPFCS